MRLFLFILLMSTVALTQAQNAEIIQLDRLQKILNQKTDNVLVVNFWATWCAPCVKELPLFEKLNAEKPDHVKITLVSMDLDLDPNPDKVFRFIERKKLLSEVFLLNEPNANDWIDKIDKHWNGALPATIVINQRTGQRIFVEKELHDGDLEKLIQKVQEK